LCGDGEWRGEPSDDRSRVGCIVGNGASPEPSTAALAAAAAAAVSGSRLAAASTMVRVRRSGGCVGTTVAIAVAVAVAVAAAAPGVNAQTYAVTVTGKGARPAISIANPRGTGYSPCQYTFNPAWLQAGPGLNASILLVRAALCPDSYGGGVDHLLFAYCDVNGTCGDVQPLQFPFEAQAEDPRVVFDAATGYYLLYYYASGPGQQTVYLRRSRTPLDPSSWELVVGQLPWHRNGCLILRPNGTHYVIFGEVRTLAGECECARVRVDSGTRMHAVPHPRRRTVRRRGRCRASASLRLRTLSTTRC